MLVSRKHCHIEGNNPRGTEGEDTVSLGNLGSGLEVPEDGVLVELQPCEHSTHWSIANGN